MKRLFLFFIFIYNSFLFAQGTSFWDTQLQLTNGYIDKNPTFATKLNSNITSSPFEFLAFERWTLTNFCNICVLKMGENGPLDSITYITNNNNINKNPSIAYNSGTLNKAMIVWESYVNSRWNIYGKTYNYGIWTSEYPIDTSSGDKHSPCVIYIDSSSNSFLFGITYEKNNDIIFKRFNALTKTIIYEINLTISDTSVCRNPGVTKDLYSDVRYYVFYERKKTNGDFAIYYRKSNTASYNWSITDTFAYLGNNRNINAFSSFPISESFFFESNRSGKWGLYQTYWEYYNSSFAQSVIIQNNTSENRNFATFLYPVIADGTAQLGTYVRQDNDSTRIISGTNIPIIVQNSITIGDTTKKPFLTISNGIPTTNSLFRVWLVYNKDSAGYSRLYACGKKYSIIGNIRKINEETPSSFSLSQNFPNPFNPSTNIGFELAKNVFVSLRIYNVLGKEIEILINRKMDAGSYNFNWDASNHPNGLYFCKLSIENKVSFTKKMILIK
ncbi:MAG: T9SS type A sorting domain-containing protein [Ignavibacteria bacterium]|jgi:hypothetical protein